MYFAACFLGHITPGEKISDSDLKHITTTLGYSDYYTTKPVRFPGDLPREKLANVRVNSSDLAAIRYVQEQLELPNHQSVVSELIQSYNNRLDTATQLESAQQKVAELSAQIKELQEANNKLEESHSQKVKELSAQVEGLQEVNNKLEKSHSQLREEKKIMESTVEQPQEVTLNVTELESWLEKKVVEVVKRLTQEGALNIPVTPATANVAKVLPPKEEIDWEAKTDAEVWGSKAPLAAQEKIRRSYQAIALYNDTVATGDSDRLAITNQALRELS
ncbi:hypothetical protein F8S20_18755 [Nostoc sp. BAE]|nr:hypothetical protein [Nostoc commune]MBG1261017.1 hypothetical protein [Nostoc commune BAE]